MLHARAAAAFITCVLTRSLALRQSFPAKPPSSQFAKLSARVSSMCARGGSTENEANLNSGKESGRNMMRSCAYKRMKDGEEAKKKS